MAIAIGHHRREVDAPGPATADLVAFMSSRKHELEVCRVMADLIARNFAECPLIVATTNANFLLENVARLACKPKGRHVEARRSWPTRTNPKPWIEGFDKRTDSVDTVIIAFLLGDDSPDEVKPLELEFEEMHQAVAGIVAVRNLGGPEVMGLPVHSAIDHTGAYWHPD